MLERGRGVKKRGSLLWRGSNDLMWVESGLVRGANGMMRGDGG